MKKLLFTVFGAAVVFAGCKEHDVYIDFKPKSVADTTYVVSPVPPADLHQVLVEEFTGQSCPNCPEAHDDLDTMEALNPNRINVISLYPPGSGTQVLPPDGSVHDFRNPVADQILNTVYSSINGLPAAGMDRTVDALGSIVYVGSTSWDGHITTQLAKTTPVNLSVSSTYDSVSGKATIVATVIYTQAVALAQNLSIVVVEDGMVDKQDKTGIPTLPNYVFIDVFRGMVTSIPSGDQLAVPGATPNAKEAGRLFKKTYSYALPTVTPAIIPSHCRVIAFVNTADGADKHVEQSVQCPLVHP